MKINHHDARRRSIMIHHDAPWWFIMTSRHDASWWLIVMTHHDASWWIIVMNHHHDVPWWVMMVIHRDDSSRCVMMIHILYPSKPGLGHQIMLRVVPDRTQLRLKSNVERVASWARLLLTSFANNGGICISQAVHRSIKGCAGHLSLIYRVCVGKFVPHPSEWGC